jgi:3'-phosphoadenosine 5'-phosphosulfate sulfotransferase (PAPS reductase)/FAD synthetase
MARRRTAQLALLPPPEPPPINLARGLVSDPAIDAALALHSPVAIGVSGGKDSDALAFEVNDHLNRIGHIGPRLLIHADLGRVEWKESGPQCERLAARLGLELVVVRREAGDMMDRWLVRWDNNVDRYVNLECVKLILPWSTASMRFCTSELKTAIIWRELVRRFRGQTIVSAVGIRRGESDDRKNAPIWKAKDKLPWKTRGLTWNGLLDWTKEEVIALHDARGFPLHPGYTVHGSSRISCAFCVLGSRADILASAGVPEHADLYREMVALEIASTFAFQDHWLGDVAPHLLDDDMREGLRMAKHAARLREQAEARIPEHLLYVKGWPTCVPTFAEARLLCDVRSQVADVLGLTVLYTEPDALIARYQELFDESRCREAAKGAA